MNALLEVALAAAFIGGFAGGAHCAGMCGGIVHALCATPDGNAGSRRFAYLFAYNAGRIASYVCAGALAGAIGQAGLLTRAAPVLQPALFALASLTLVALGLYIAGVLPLIARLETAGARLWSAIQPWTRHMLPVTSLPRALGLGALWGWLPCGMVYAVLLTALALGSWWQGAAIMLAFGAGTLPNLLGLGLLWKQIGKMRRAGIARVCAGCVVAVFGVYSLFGVFHAGGMAADGLLCHVIPGLDNWLR
jgi:sulfite exporter TauE/SafE